mgnify:FL=1
MISFKELREGTKGKLVHDKKYGKYKAQIYKDGAKFHAFLDGDRLDTFRNQQDAEKSIETMVKAL